MQIITPRKTRWEKVRSWCSSWTPQVKQRVIGGIFLIVVSVGGCLLHRAVSNNRTLTATTSGGDSPATVFSASTTGSNSPITQTVINNGYLTNEMKAAAEKQDEMLAILRRMEDTKRDKDAELKAKFQFGYILFSATERKEIIPLKSPMDEIFKVDWNSGYEVSITDSHVNLRLPNMAIHSPDGTVAAFTNSSVGVLRSIEPWARPGIFNNGRIRIAPKLVSTNDNVFVIALGIQSPPEPRPSLEELNR